MTHNQRQRASQAACPPLALASGFPRCRCSLWRVPVCFVYTGNLKNLDLAESFLAVPSSSYEDRGALRGTPGSAYPQGCQLLGRWGHSATPVSATTPVPATTPQPPQRKASGPDEREYTGPFSRTVIRIISPHQPHRFTGPSAIRIPVRAYFGPKKADFALPFKHPRNEWAGQKGSRVAVTCGDGWTRKGTWPLKPFRQYQSP